MIIAISFLLLASVGLLLVIGNRISWKIKAVFVILVPLFMFAVWHAVGTYRGWPAHEQVPRKSIVVSYIIAEPDPARGDPGHIDLWLIPASRDADIISYHPGEGEPRAIRVPYSRPLQRALQALGGKQGTPILERVNISRKGHGNHRRPGQSNQKWAYRAYVLPPSLQNKGE